LNSYVTGIDLNGHAVKLTDAEIAQLTGGISDSSSGTTGVVSELITGNGNLTSTTLNSHVTSIDVNGTAVTLNESQMSAITSLSDSFGGGSVTENLTSSGNVTLANHATVGIDVNLSGYSGTSISNLLSGDQVNIGTSSSLTAATSAGAVNASGEYYFDTSSHVLTYDNSTGTHTVTLVNINSVQLQSDNHTLKMV
jgi:hypothetical protein